MESILLSIKKLLGMSEDYTAFDTDVTMHINSVFSILRQLGIGPKEGFVIEDASANWSDFLGDKVTLELVKTYMYMKVKLIFDPPLNASVLQSYKDSIAEFEWRGNVEAETPET